MSTEKEKIFQSDGIGSRLRALRQAENLPVRKFAERHGLSYSEWSTYENDKRKPNATTIDKLCQEFGVTADWIIRGEAARELKSDTTEARELLDGSTGGKTSGDESPKKGKYKKGTLSHLPPRRDAGKGARRK